MGEVAKIYVVMGGSKKSKQNQFVKWTMYCRCKFDILQNKILIAEKV